MKKLITAGVFITLLASPAFAQTIRHVHAQMKTNHAALADNNNGPHGEIIWGGSVRGEDPDPFIRESIVRGLGNYGGD